MREFDLPELDRDDAEGWVIYDLPEIALPFPPPTRGIHYCACELEYWGDEPFCTEVLIKKDSEINLRQYLTVETEQKVIQKHRWKSFKKNGRK